MIIKTYLNEKLKDSSELENCCVTVSPSENPDASKGDVRYCGNFVKYYSTDVEKYEFHLVALSVLVFI